MEVRKIYGIKNVMAELSDLTHLTPAKGIQTTLHNRKNDTMTL